MASTPPPAALGRLLSGINNGWNALRSRVSDAAEEESPLPAENGEIQIQNESNDENVEPVATTANVTTPARRPSTAAVVAAEALVTMDSNRSKKRPAATPNRQKKKPAAKAKNDNKNESTVGVDPDVRTVVNPLSMEAAFEEGYDSDGWTGPPTGTDPKELELAEEEELPVANDDEVIMEEPQPNMDPMHIPISDDDLKKLKVEDIKHELAIRRIEFPKSGPNGRKGPLLERLKEALEKKCLVYPDVVPRKKGEVDMSAFAVGAKWRELSADVDVEEPENVDMPHARAPTIPEEERKVPPCPKKHFSRQFQRPQFQGRQRGGPKESFLKKHFLNVNSLPSEYAEAFFPMFENEVKDEKGKSFISMQEIARNTNMKAGLAFAGEATYVDWSGNFTVKEVRQHLGLYILNGLSPSPGLERKFDPNDHANFNCFVSEHMGGPKKNPIRRLRQFKAFMTLQDPRKDPPNRKDSPLFKVLPMIKWINKIGPDSWECGIDIGLDEQTIGFKGMHVDKLRITYKAEGDGFQCDALCDDGFTFSVFFRNELPPKELVDLGLSPLHARSVWLFNQLQEKYHRVWVDNLYMSAKFAKAGYKSNNKVLLNGVARTAARGVPPVVLQEPVAKESDAASVRGTVKAAVLEGDDDCPNLVAMSVYDTKPVHFISLACEAIQWIVKKRKVWNQLSRAMVEVNFLRINLNDNYNQKMNAVDLADQLRNHYRMDYWLRQRKWWWAIFLWSFGVLLVNPYKVYCRVQEQAGVLKKDWLTHYDFLHQIAVSWIDVNEKTPDIIRREHRKQEKNAERAAAVAAEASQENQIDNTPARSSRGRALSPTRAVLHQVSPSTPTRTSPAPTNARRTPNTTSPKRVAVKVSDNSLHPEKGALRIRLHHFNKYHGPLPPTAAAPSCSLHRYLKSRESGSQTRGQVFLCRVCNVHLCLHCFETFHTVHDIAEKKDLLCSLLPPSK